LRLQCGMPCSKLEVSTVQHGTLSGAGYLHQSLLDDPTVGVDPHTRELIFATITSLAQSGAIILIRSSEPEQLARHCTRVVVIRDGRVTREFIGADLNTEKISLATFA
jgi:ABC-type sugar transport system ATPase subunit